MLVWAKAQCDAKSAAHKASANLPQIVEFKSLGQNLITRVWFSRGLVIPGASFGKYLRICLKAPSLLYLDGTTWFEGAFRWPNWHANAVNLNPKTTKKLAALGI